MFNNVIDLREKINIDKDASVDTKSQSSSELGGSHSVTLPNDMFIDTIGQNRKLYRIVDESLIDYIVYLPRVKLSSSLFVAKKWQYSAYVLLEPNVGTIKTIANNIRTIENYMKGNTDDISSSISDGLQKLRIKINTTTPYAKDAPKGLMQYAFNVYNMNHEMIDPRPLESGVDVSMYLSCSSYINEHDTMMFSWNVKQLKVYEDYLFDKYLFNLHDHEEPVEVNSVKQSCVFCKESTNNSVQMIDAVSYILDKLKIDKPIKKTTNTKKITL